MQLLNIYLDQQNLAAASCPCGTRLASAARWRNLHKHAGRSTPGTLSKQPERRQEKNSTNQTGKESKVNNVVTASGKPGEV